MTLNHRQQKVTKKQQIVKNTKEGYKKPNGTTRLYLQNVNSLAIKTPVENQVVLQKINKCDPYRTSFQPLSVA